MEKRNTIQKKLIKEVVLSLNTHPTADEVYNIVHESNPSVSRATVYRNLSYLVSIGEIKKIEAISGGDRFDFRTDKHYHIQCERCKKIYDIEVPYTINEEDIEENDFEITGHTLIFKGICGKCREEI